MADISLQIISLTEQLIDVINNGDYDLYSQIVDPNVTAFEPEAHGKLIQGLEFHKFYFDASELLHLGIR